MNVSSTAIQGLCEPNRSQICAPAEDCHFAEPERPRNPLPGMLISVALGLGLWGVLGMIVLG